MTASCFSYNIVNLLVIIPALKKNPILVHLNDYQLDFRRVSELEITTLINTAV